MSRTVFDDFFEEQMADPEFAQAYAEARAEVDAADQEETMSHDTKK